MAEGVGRHLLPSCVLLTTGPTRTTARPPRPLPASRRPPATTTRRGRDVLAIHAVALVARMHLPRRRIKIFIAAGTSSRMAIVNSILEAAKVHEDEQQSMRADPEIVEPALQLLKRTNQADKAGRGGHRGAAQGGGRGAQRDALGRARHRKRG